MRNTRFGISRAIAAVVVSGLIGLLGVQDAKAGPPECLPLIWEKVSLGVKSIRLEVSGDHFFVIGRSSPLLHVIEKRECDTGDLVWRDAWGWNGETTRLALDSTGAVYIVGTTLYTWMIQKYVDLGDSFQKSWYATYDFGANGHQSASAIAIDKNDVLWVGGFAVEDATRKCAVMRFDSSSGAPIGDPIFMEPTFQGFRDAIAINDAVVFVGQAMDPGYKVIVRKLDLNGQTLQSTFYDGISFEEFTAHGVAADAEGFLYVAGTEDTRNEDYNAFLLKLDSNLNLMPGWDPISWDGRGWDYGYDVDVRSDGKVAVACKSTDGSNAEPAILEYIKNGRLQCVQFVETPVADDGYSGIVYDPNDGGLITTGRGSLEGATYQFVMHKHLAQTRKSPNKPQVLTVVDGRVGPGEVRVVSGSGGFVDAKRGQSAVIDAYPTESGELAVSVYSRAGSLVKHLTVNVSGSAAVELSWDGTDASGAPAIPGIYAIVIEGPGLREVRKVAVLR